MDNVAEQKYYRLVDNLLEKPDMIIDTAQSKLSPRMQQTVKKIKLFNIMLYFWAKSGVQLDTACRCMTQLNAYLPEIQTLEREGSTDVPLCLINSDEKLASISLETLKLIIIPYCDHYANTGEELNDYDLPYLWEYLWEFVRTNLYKDKLSRFQSIFLFDSIKAVEEFRDSNGIAGTICNVELLDTYALEKYDMRWLDQIPVTCTWTELLHTVSNYWEGHLTDNPQMEYLFSGKYRLKHAI